MHIGGNNADNGADVDTFSENYISLLNTLSAKNRRIIVSGLLPRQSVDLKPYNEILKNICDENDIEFIDNYDSFLLASGEMPHSFFQNDKLHLNISGTRRLLSNINKVVNIVRDSSRAGNPMRFQSLRSARTVSRSTRKVYHPSPKYCHICTRRGHSIQECWYNGRGTPRPDSGLNTW